MRILCLITLLLFCGSVLANEKDKARAAVAIEIAKLSLKSEIAATVEVKIPPCKCGCMETGQCKCKNCAERTADPDYVADCGENCKLKKTETAKMATVETVKPKQYLYQYLPQYGGYVLVEASVETTNPTPTFTSTPSGCSSCANGTCKLRR